MIPEAGVFNKMAYVCPGVAVLFFGNFLDILNMNL